MLFSQPQYVTLSILPSPDRTTSYLPISCVLLFILCILLCISQSILSCWLLYRWITALFFNVGNTDDWCNICVRWWKAPSNLPPPTPFQFTLLTSTLETIDARGRCHHQLPFVPIDIRWYRWRWYVNTNDEWTVTLMSRCSSTMMVHHIRCIQAPPIRTKHYTRSRGGNDGKDDKEGRSVMYPCPDMNRGGGGCFVIIHRCTSSKSCNFFAATTMTKEGRWRVRYWWISITEVLECCLGIYGVPREPLAAMIVAWWSTKWTSLLLNVCVWPDFFFLTSHTSTLMGQCSSNIRSTPAFSTSKCAQEQGLCIDVGIDLWLYAGLSRNKHVKDATTFTVTLRSISRYHIFDKNRYTTTIGIY